MANKRTSANSGSGSASLAISSGVLYMLVLSICLTAQCRSFRCRLCSKRKMSNVKSNLVHNYSSKYMQYKQHERQSQPHPVLQPAQTQLKHLRGVRKPQVLQTAAGILRPKPDFIAKLSCPALDTGNLNRAFVTNSQAASC